MCLEIILLKYVSTVKLGYNVPVREREKSTLYPKYVISE